MNALLIPFIVVSVLVVILFFYNRTLKKNLVKYKDLAYDLELKRINLEYKYEEAEVINKTLRSELEDRRNIQASKIVTGTKPKTPKTKAKSKVE